MMTRLLPISSVPVPVIDSDVRFTLLVPKGVPAVTLSAKRTVLLLVIDRALLVGRAPAAATNSVPPVTLVPPA